MTHETDKWMCKMFSDSYPSEICLSLYVLVSNIIYSIKSSSNKTLNRSVISQYSPGGVEYTYNKYPKFTMISNTQNRGTQHLSNNSLYKLPASQLNSCPNIIFPQMLEKGLKDQNIPCCLSWTCI